MRTCDHPGCESNDVRRYLNGHFCPEHTPAARAGRPEVIPDPAHALDALRGRMLEQAKGLRDAAFAAVSSSSSDTAGRALRIIRWHAEENEFVSANDVRQRMESAEVPGNFRGPAFHRAVKAGYLEPIALQTSTDPGTHSKPVQTYRSLIYRKQESV